jgi:Rrf2 family protein
MLSQKTKYGLKALCLLARESASGPRLVADIADRERIPRKFLETILLDLKHSGIVQSKKGRGGGYMLGRPADRIRVGDVVRSLNGPLALVGCVSETAYRPCAECADEPSCAVHLLMKDVRDATANILDRRTLAQVAGDVHAAGHGRGRTPASNGRR